MTPFIYNFDELKRGDSWDGIPYIELFVNEEPPVFPCASVRMQFRKSDGSLGMELTSADGGIVIEDAIRWHFSLPERVTWPLETGKYYYDLEFTDTRGFRKTYIEGEQPVKKDISH